MSSQSQQDSTSEKEYVDQSKPQEAQSESSAWTEDEPLPCLNDAIEDEDEDGKYDASPADPTSPTTTVMIYLAGDNNLTDECIYALTELKKARPSELVKIYVQFDPSDEFLPTQRYEINRCGSEYYKSPVALDLIDQFPFKHESKKCLKIKPAYGEQRERKGESGTGDPRMLFNFVAFCVDQPHKPQPARKTNHYVLIICGHGAGIQRDFLLRDDRPEGYLTIYELRSALKLMRKRLKGKDPSREFKLDLFGMDVCLMSMAEITYELRDVVEIAIGNESYSPAAGWPYKQTIKKIDRFARAAKASLPHNVWEAIAKNIVKEYVRFYSDYWLGGLSVSMSALRAHQGDELAHRVRALANEMINELREEWDRKQEQLYRPGTTGKAERHAGSVEEEYASRWNHKRYPPLLFSDTLILAHWRAQSYNGELYVDLVDLCNCLAQYVPEDSTIARLCHELSHFIRKDFVIESCTFGRSYQYSYGVSIYFPWQSLVPYYGASIRFPKNSNWLSFLNTYLLVTRRAPRFFNCKPDKDEVDDEARKKLFEFNVKLVAQNFTGVRMGPDKMGPDKMGIDEVGNPIHSMRNPPIVFIPDCCTSTTRRLLNAMAEFRLMRNEIDPRELLPDPRITELEKTRPSWLLLTKESIVTSDQLESDNVDEV